MNQTPIGLDLLKSGKYFHSRPLPESNDWSDYWKPKPDPDGKVRDRSKERDLYLRQVADEVALVQLHFADANRFGVFVDVGCGAGWFMRIVPDTVDRFGIDPGLPRSEFERQAVMPKGGHGNYHLQRMTLNQAYREYKIPTANVDLIRAHHVIEHIPDPIEAIKQMHAMLKPGGWLLISTPDFDSQAARRFGERYRMLHDPTHCSLFSYESFLRFLRDHGFKVARVEFPFWEVDEWVGWSTPDKEEWVPCEDFNPWSAMTCDKKQQDRVGISPPFPGSWMICYCRKE